MDVSEAVRVVRERHNTGLEWHQLADAADVLVAKVKELEQSLKTAIEVSLSKTETIDTLAAEKADLERRLANTQAGADALRYIADLRRDAERWKEVERHAAYSPTESCDHARRWVISFSAKPGLFVDHVDAAVAMEAVRTTGP